MATEFETYFYWILMYYKDREKIVAEFNLINITGKVELKDWKSESPEPSMKVLENLFLSDNKQIKAFSRKALIIREHKLMYNHLVGDHNMTQDQAVNKIYEYLA